jgi:transposase
MTEMPQVTHIRVDDIPLLVGILMQMNLAEIYDREIGDHGLHRGLSGGWLITVWLVFILSQGDHTKSNVAEWVERHADVLQRLTGQPITAGEFNDTRLGRLLSRLSQADSWERFETALWRHSVRVYELVEASVGGLTSAMVDSTTAYGHHAISATGVMQRGYSKDHRPDLPQLKLMTASLHPTGHWIATEVVNGKVADDDLYTPLIARVRATLGRVGLLYVGDCKMAALTTRAELAGQGDYYLTVAPQTGEVAHQQPSWIELALKEGQLIKEGNETLGIAWESSRICQGPPGGQQPLEWTERVQVIRSDALRAKQAQTLQQRLKRAEAALWALNQPRGRGHRRLTHRAEFEVAVQTILDKYGVSYLLEVTPHIEEQREQHLVGRGRRGPNRPTHEVIVQRYTVAGVQRVEAVIAHQVERLGWRVQLTNAPVAISLEMCVAHYRANWLGERNYHLLKHQPIGISPLFVRKDDQIIGLTHLLTLGVRVLSLLELQVRRGLQAEHTPLAGLYPGNPKQATDRPTAMLILEAIARREITLTRMTWHEQTLTHLTPLPELLVQVLNYLRLPTTLYTNLVAQNSPNTT